MAVPKTTETSIGMVVCRQDRVYKDYTSNPIPTSFFHVIVQEISANSTDGEEKRM